MKEDLKEIKLDLTLNKIIPNIITNYLRVIKMGKLNEKGIGATATALEFFGSAVIAIHKSLKDDGKITVKDLPKFWDPVKNCWGFISTIKDIPAELKDIITDEEKEYLVKKMKDLGFDSDYTSELVERWLTEIIEIKKLIEDTLEVLKK